MYSDVETVPYKSNRQVHQAINESNTASFWGLVSDCSPYGTAGGSGRRSGTWTASRTLHKST